jgi:hypothetical protein
MKRIIIIMICVLFCSIKSYSQNHFPNSSYIEVLTGLSDQKAFEPNIGYGYNLSDVISLNARYSFKTISKTDQYRFSEHNLDLLCKYTAYNYKDLGGINVFAGATQSINKYSDLPRPTFSPKSYNVGYVVGCEIEYFLNNNMALFAGASNKGFFLDKTHLEMNYSIGVRTDLSIFTSTTRRR